MFFARICTEPSSTRVRKNIRSKSTAKEVKAVRQFFDDLSNKLNIQKLEDWNHVTVEDIYRTGANGSFLQRNYKGSLSQGKCLEIFTV
jgi:hypothetical protein